MTTFYICRHGLTENNKKQRFSGWIDTPLTPEGEDNAISAANKLSGIHIDRIVSSDLGRAFVTAYIMAKRLKLEINIERNPLFKEMNYGEFANQPYSAYPLLTDEENTVFTPKGGESLIQMQARVLSGIDKLSKESPGKNILLVAHDGTINAIRATSNHEEIGSADHVHNPHDFVAKFEYEEGKIISFVVLKG